MDDQFREGTAGLCVFYLFFEKFREGTAGLCLALPAKKKKALYLARSFVRSVLRDSFRATVRSNKSTGTSNTVLLSFAATWKDSEDRRDGGNWSQVISDQSSKLRWNLKPLDLKIEETEQDAIH